MVLYKISEDVKKGIEIHETLDGIVKALRQVQAQPEYIQQLNRCPPDFREAFVRWVNALEMMQSFAQSAPKTTDQAILTGILNGLAGEPDGGYTRTNREWNTRVDAVHEAHNNLRAIAQRYTSR